jgi:hypothetical protein
MTLTIAEPTIFDFMLLASNARPDEIEQYESVYGKRWILDEVVNYLYNRPGAKTVLLDDKNPVVIWGWEPANVGVANLWGLGTMEHWDRYWRSITKYVRRDIDNLLNGGVRRVQILALTKRKKTCEWFRRGLRLEEEATLKGFAASGDDVSIFARIAEE